jgi:aryl-alcohol dehydrogenase-like predicted oxidoreductase
MIHKAPDAGINLVDTANAYASLGRSSDRELVLTN